MTSPEGSTPPTKTDGTDGPPGASPNTEAPPVPSMVGPKEERPGKDTASAQAAKRSDGSRSHRRGPHLSVRSLDWFVAAAAGAAYTAYSVVQWRNFAVPSWDLGIFTELAKQYSGFHEPIVDIKGPDFNLLGDHFHPLLVLLGPVYWLFPSGLTLLIVQDLLFAVSAVPIMRLASARLGNRFGMLLAVAYLASWGLWSAVESQFHEIAFAVPLVSYGLCSWIESEGHSRTAVAAIASLVFVKEDLGLTVAAFGAIVVWIEWGRATRTGRFALRVRSLASLKAALRTRVSKIGIGLAVWGAAWTALTILVILPALNPEGSWEYTGRLSGTETTDVNLLARLVLPSIKLQTLGLLVLAAGVIGAASPFMWMMAPTLAWRFLGNVDFYWGWDWHYSAILMPMACAALIDSASRWRRVRHLGLLAALVSLCSNSVVSWNTTVDQFVDGQPHAVSAPQRAAAEGAVEAVGSGRRVVGSLRLLAYLVPDNRVFWEGTADGADVDAVALDPSSTAGVSRIPADRWAEERFGGDWTLIYSREWYQVAVRAR